MGLKTDGDEGKMDMDKSAIDAIAIENLHAKLWEISCRLKAIGNLLKAVNSSEVEFNDETFWGLGTIILQLAKDIDTMDR